MANAILSEYAVQDLQGIADYTLEQFGIGQALDYDILIDRAIQMAANFPSIGRSYATQRGQVFKNIMQVVMQFSICQKKVVFLLFGFFI